MMDERQFETLAKDVGTSGSRRRLLAGLLGAILTGSLDRATVTAKGKQQHRRRQRVQAQKGNSQNAKRCQKGGWATLAPSEDPTTPFANQDACVSYGAQGGTIVDLVIPTPQTVTVTWIQDNDDHIVCKATVAVAGFAPGTYDVRALGPFRSNSIEGSIVVGTGGTGTTVIPTNGSFDAGLTYVVEVNGIESEASVVAC